MKMRISVRLAIAFAAMLLLVIVTAVVGIVSLNRIGEATSTMVQEAKQTATLGSIRGGVQLVQDSLLGVCENPTEQGRSNLKLLLATVNGEITDFEHPMRPAGTTMAQFQDSNPEMAATCGTHCHDDPAGLELETKRTNFTLAVQGLMSQSETQEVNVPLARSFISTSTGELLLAADELAQQKMIYLSGLRDEVADIESSTRRLMLAAAIVAAIAGVVLAVIITRSITLPLAKLVMVSDKISTGELETPVPVAAKDEIGELAESMERMRISIKALVERMRTRSSG